jgi:hypothetical protein
MTQFGPNFNPKIDNPKINSKISSHAKNNDLFQTAATAWKEFLQTGI